MEQIIYIKLLDEGSIAYRPVKVLRLDNNLFKILDSPSADEIWEFQFNDIVQCKELKLSDGFELVAIKRI
ncbi:MAG: hypothetical protein JWP94_1064 [Mucilaginibacter sp.]|nr:hypothetical protein [Mucilaginibacter sp.]